MARIAFLIHGVIAYAIAMASIVYAVGFVGNYWVPKSIDSGVPGDTLTSIIVNLCLLGLFAIQHSVMARPAFKKAWTRIVPQPIERSTYVLLSALVLILLYHQWQPMTDTVWYVENAFGATLLQAIYFLGWGIVVASTFMLSHGELFGLQQVASYWQGKTTPQPKFLTPFLYKFVRHPIYFGFLLALWATPHMTTGHLLFAAASSIYIVLGATLEERDLMTVFGDHYKSYRQRVPMLLPWPRGKDQGN